MTKKYIANNEEAAKKINEKLAGTLFKDVDTFIENYNLGVINPNSPQMRDLAKEITNAYSNITEPKKGTLVVMSSKEIIVTDAIERLEAWASIAKLKRAVNDKLSAGVIEETDFIVFGEGRKVPGVARTSEDTEEVNIENITEERIIIDEKVIDVMAEYRGDDIPFAEEVESIGLEVKDILSFNDDFIENIGDIIPKTK